MDCIFDSTGKTRCHKVITHPFLPIIFTAGMDFNIYAWDITTKNLLYTLEGHTDWINSLSFDPSGKFLISGSNDTTVFYWDLDNPSNNRILARHWNRVTSVIWDNTGLMFASGSYDTAIRIWDAVTLEWLQTLEVHTQRVNCLTAHPNLPMFASGSADRSIIIWDWRTGKQICRIKEHKDDIRHLVSNDQYIISISDDRTIRFWKWPDLTNDIAHMIYYSSFKTIPIEYSSGLYLKENKLVYRNNIKQLCILDISNENPNEWTSKDLNVEKYYTFSHWYSNIITLIPSMEDHGIRVVLGGYTLGNPIIILDLSI
jgi:WD40 repeat protein